MQALPLSVNELIELVLYFSAIVLLLGVAFQLWTIYRKDKIFSLKMLLVIFTTQLLVFISTFLIWSLWPDGLKVLIGPFFIPAVIAELILMPIVSAFFKYRISFKR